MSDVKEISLCKSCNAEIVWMKTRNDKNIPVDMPDIDHLPPPDKADRDEILAATVYDRTRMTAHFDTCPDASDYRKRKSSEKRQEMPASGDAEINTRRLNIAVKVLEEIVKNPPDGMRAVDSCRTALAQIRKEL